ncbi:MAG: TlpA family protein disulfide reductase [Prevotella sp.]
MKVIVMFMVVWTLCPLWAGAQILKGDKKAIAEAINKAYSYSYFFPFENEDTLHLTTEQKRQTLDQRYAEVKAELAKMPEGSEKAYYAHVNEDAYLNFQMRLCYKDTVARKALISRIDPNDTISLLNYLPQRFIESKMQGDYSNDWGHDLTNYGLEYISVMRRYITSPKVKHELLSNCAREVLSYGKGYADIDRFWLPFVEYAADDTVVIKKYQFKVDAIKRTKPGSSAIDFTFEDAAGKRHRLSEFRGKTLYIDCWATWCGPCCKEIPFLERQVEALKDKSNSLVFISISLDRKRQAWLDKLAKDKPQWLQFIADKEGDEILSRQYGITGIPRFIIIRPDWTIGDADAFRPSDPDFIKKILQL